LRISDRWREAIRKLEYRRPELGNSDSLLSTLAESAALLVKDNVTSVVEVTRVLGA
jgi:hypothetical protein